MHYQRVKKGRSDLDAPKNALPGRNRKCSHPNCNRKHLSKGHCSIHYDRAKNGRDMDAPIREAGVPRLCSVQGCNQPHSAKGYCSTHSSRYYAGRPIDAPVRSHQPIGAKTIDEQGYVRIKISDDNPNRRKNWVKEHRHIMEQHLGRPLHSDESVHHINGDKTDNRIENLELWSRSHPSGQRVEDKIQWAIDFLSEYAPQRLTQPAK